MTATYHTWFVAHHDDGAMEVVDLAARHYPEQARRGSISWTLPDPPSFIWAWEGKLPTGIVLTYSAALTAGFARGAPNQLESLVTPLADIALALYLRVDAE